MSVASGLFSWSMVAGLLASSSRQLSLTINHGPLSVSHYFSFLSKRSGRRMPPAGRSALYVPVYMVRRGSKGSPVCYVLVRTTCKYAFIFPYLAPGALLLLLLLLLCAFIYLALIFFCTCCFLHYTSNWYQGTRYRVYITLRAVGSTKKSKKIAKRVGMYQHLVPGQSPPRESWFAAFLDCVPGILLLLLLLCAFICLVLMIFCTCCFCSHYTSDWYQGTRCRVYITLRAVGTWYIQ